MTPANQEWDRLSMQPSALGLVYSKKGETSDVEKVKVRHENWEQGKVRRYVCRLFFGSGGESSSSLSSSEHGRFFPRTYFVGYSHCLQRLAHALQNDRQ